MAVLPAPAALEPAKLGLGAFRGHYVQHLNNHEMQELPLESNPSDHPKASTIFLNKSEMDEQEKRNYLNRVCPVRLTKKYS